jgi:hypothetical protein
MCGFVIALSQRIIGSSPSASETGGYGDGRDFSSRTQRCVILIDMGNAKTG